MLASLSPVLPDPGGDAALERLLVRVLMLELSHHDRQAVELRVFHGWSAEEISSYAGTNAFEVRLALARFDERCRHRRGDLHPLVVLISVPPPPVPVPVAAMSGVVA